MSPTVSKIPSPSVSSEQSFMDLRVLVEYDQKHKFFVAYCLQTGSVVTADDQDTAVDMIKELLVDEVSYAIVHSNLRNLFASPAPLEIWKKWSTNAAKHGSQREKVVIVARELRLDEPEMEVNVARAAVA